MGNYDQFWAQSLDDASPKPPPASGGVLAPPRPPAAPAAPGTGQTSSPPPAVPAPRPIPQLDYAVTLGPVPSAQAAARTRPGLRGPLVVAPESRVSPRRGLALAVAAGLVAAVAGARLLAGGDVPGLGPQRLAQLPAELAGGTAGSASPWQARLDGAARRLGGSGVLTGAYVAEGRPLVLVLAAGGGRTAQQAYRDVAAGLAVPDGSVGQSAVYRVAGGEVTCGDVTVGARAGGFVCAWSGRTTGAVWVPGATTAMTTAKTAAEVRAGLR